MIAADDWQGLELGLKLDSVSAGRVIVLPMEDAAGRVGSVGIWMVGKECYA